MITHSPAQAEYSIGEEIAVTVSATNNGPSPADDSTVEIDLPAGLSLIGEPVEGDDDDEFDPDSGIWSIDEIPGNGNNRTRTVTFTVAPNATGSHTITATFTGSGSGFNERNPADDEDSLTILVPGETTTTTTDETTTTTTTTDETTTTTTTDETTTDETTTSTDATTSTTTTDETTTNLTTTTVPLTTTTTTSQGTTTGSTTTPGTTTTTTTNPPTTLTSQPVEGEKINAEETTGEVFVKLPGQKPRLINPEGELLPPGTKIDASDGTVVITSEYNGTFEQIEFWDGAFKLGQKESKDPVTVVKLINGFGANGSEAGAAARTQTAKKKRGKKSRRLWGKSNKGHFRTQGRSGSATVRGTKWKTVDRPSGKTKFVLKRGKLFINDFSRGGKVDKVLKRKGKYVADPKAPNKKKAKKRRR